MRLSKKETVEVERLRDVITESSVVGTAETQYRVLRAVVKAIFPGRQKAKHVEKIIHEVVVPTARQTIRRILSDG